MCFSRGVACGSGVAKHHFLHFRTKSILSSFFEESEYSLSNKVHTIHVVEKCGYYYVELNPYYDILSKNVNTKANSNIMNIRKNLIRRI